MKEESSRRGEGKIRRLETKGLPEVSRREEEQKKMWPERKMGRR